VTVTSADSALNQVLIYIFNSPEGSRYNTHNLQN